MSIYAYPVALDLSDRRCLVVGAGALARDKVEGLQRARGRVLWVLGTVSGDREPVGRDPGDRVEIHARNYRPEDLNGVYLAYGASDDRDLNARVAADGRARGVIVNAVDDIPNCDFFAMAMVRRGDLQIAISTNGRSPAFARWLRERLEAEIPLAFGTLLYAVGDVRDAVRAGGVVPAYDRWAHAIGNELDRQNDGARPEGMTARLLSDLMQREQIEPAGIQA